MPVVQLAQANAMLLHPTAVVCAGVMVLKAFRADPSKSIVDYLLELSKVAAGLRSQDVAKLRGNERSLQHLADDLRVHKLYVQARSARHRERDRQAGRRRLHGAPCARYTFCLLLSSADATAIRDQHADCKVWKNTAASSLPLETHVGLSEPCSIAKPVMKPGTRTVGARLHRACSRTAQQDDASIVV